MKMKTRKTYSLPKTGTKAFKTAALITLAALLCGCTVFDASPESLLSPPKLTATQTEIYKAFTQVTGSTELVYPRSGDFRSAFVLHDLDEESTDEAIVFYRTKETAQNESGLRMNFLDKVDGAWMSVIDQSLAGTEVESVAFTDFGMGTGIVVRSSVKGQTEQAVSVLRYQSRQVTELYRSNYTFLETTDMDNNSLSELFLIGYDSALGCYVAHLVQPLTDELGNTAMGDISNVILPPDIAGSFSMTRQRLGDADNLIFLDFYKGSSVYGTQLLRCANNNLLRLFSDGLNRRVNSFTPNLSSTDIDGDGRIEVPTTAPLPGYENMSIPEQLNTVEWYYAEEKNFTLTKKSTSYIPAGREYMLYIPVRWQGLVTVSRSGSTVNIIKYDDDPETLLSIYISSDGTAPDENYERWGKSGSSTIFVNNSESEDPMVLTEDELKSCLVIPES